MMERMVIKQSDFRDMAAKLYGDNPRYWKFKCPRCGTAQSGDDLVRAGLSDEEAQKQMGFSCIGRTDKKKGCDWTLGGLFQIHKIEIEDDDGVKHPFFELADQTANEASDDNSN
ncbi:MAG: hypothetical protein MJA29_07485 [Candidatus Omnitrophica bacterium]|nr:hypothetical protein [Candidatus Omnitrophota bacterium]